MKLLIAMGLFILISCKSEKKSGVVAAQSPAKDTCLMNMKFIDSVVAAQRSEVDSLKRMPEDPESNYSIKTKDSIVRLLEEKRDFFQRQCDSMK